MEMFAGVCVRVFTVLRVMIYDVVEYKLLVLLFMPYVLGLRSPYALVGHMVYFGRMLDKIRLYNRKALPEDYLTKIGDARPELLDAQCCKFLDLSHADLSGRVLEGGADEELLVWCREHGKQCSDEDYRQWNSYVARLGWRDEFSESLRQAVQDARIPSQAIDTYFDLIDFREGRNSIDEKAWQNNKVTRLIIMGVSGTGKSSVGKAIADEWGWNFLDADDFHPAANKAKMASGKPLSDEDRLPWLKILAEQLDKPRPKGVVLACSALKDVYRQILSPDLGKTRYIFLHGSVELIRQRMMQRSGHFMPPALLESQMKTLEAPVDALKVDVAPSLDEIVMDIGTRLMIAR